MNILIRIDHVAKEEYATVKLLGTYETHDEAFESMQRGYAEKLDGLFDPRKALYFNRAWVEDEFFDSWEWLIFDCEHPLPMSINLDSYAWGCDEE